MSCINEIFNKVTLVLWIQLVLSRALMIMKVIQAMPFYLLDGPLLDEPSVVSSCGRRILSQFDLAPSYRDLKHPRSRQNF